MNYNPKKILIIEDEKQIADAYISKFSDEKLSVIKARTGEEGLTQAKAKPDLIILDLMLPGGLNGFDVLRQLKNSASTSSIPVLVLSNLDHEKEAVLRLGALDFIVKTNISLEELTEKIHLILKI